MCGGFS